jgi:hypothetical protein
MERSSAGGAGLRRIIEPFISIAAPVFFIGLGASLAQDRSVRSAVAFEPEEIVVALAVDPPAPMTIDVEPEVVVATPPPTGLLQVNAPEGAQVFVDGRRVGRAPVTAAKVVEGEHTIRIVHGGIEVSDVAQVPARATIHYDPSFTIAEE